jgi:hypothetical protein
MLMIAKEKMRRCLPLASIQSKELPGLEKIKRNSRLPSVVVLNIDDLKCTKMKQEISYEKISSSSELQELMLRKN